MSDESYSPASEPAAEPTPEPTAPATPEPPAGPSANAEWSAVVAQMGALGDAIAAWARAAVNDPDAQRHLDEVRSGVNAIARKAESTFNDVAASDFGQQVRQGAEQAGAAIGDTAQKVSEVAAPHVASAFAGLADVFGKAAARAEEVATRSRQERADVPAAAESETSAAPASEPAPQAPEPPSE